MSKYQEALNIVERILLREETFHIPSFSGKYSLGKVTPKTIEPLKELVYKETPMKPIKLGDNKFSCKSCAMAFTVKNLKNRFLSHTYCDVCGQRLDWSEDKEQGENNAIKKR